MKRTKELIVTLTLALTIGAGCKDGGEPLPVPPPDGGSKDGGKDGGGDLARPSPDGIQWLDGGPVDGVSAGPDAISADGHVLISVSDAAGLAGDGDSGVRTSDARAGDAALTDTAVLPGPDTGADTLVPGRDAALIDAAWSVDAARDGAPADTPVDTAIDTLTDANPEDSGEV